jgi:hypothetical protein
MIKIILLGVLTLGTLISPIDKCWGQDSEANVLALSKMLGDTLDITESEKYDLFHLVDGFQSAVLFELPDSTYSTGRDSIR